MNDPPRAPSPAEGTSGQLLAAARELFAERGYDGASVRAITSRAGANLGAITYHFGSKEALYNTLLTRMVTPLRDRVLREVARDASVADRIDGVVDAYFDHLRRHPDMPRFLLERIASGQAPPPPVAALMGSILHALSSLMREGQAEGSIRPGDPLLQALSLISQPVYLSLVLGPIREVAAEIATSPDEHRDQAVRHAREFVRAGLAPPSPPAS